MTSVTHRQKHALGDDIAGAKGWLIGHWEGNGQYVCPNCKEAIWEALPLGSEEGRKRFAVSEVETTEYPYPRDRSAKHFARDLPHAVGTLCERSFFCRHAEAFDFSEGGHRSCCVEVWLVSHFLLEDMRPGRQSAFAGPGSEFASIPSRIEARPRPDGD